MFSSLLKPADASLGGDSSEKAPEAKPGFTIYPARCRVREKAALLFLLLALLAPEVGGSPFKGFGAGEYRSEGFHRFSG